MLGFNNYNYQDLNQDNLIEDAAESIIKDNNANFQPI